MSGFPAIGTTVRKRFDGHGWFHGRVAFYTQSKFCRVIYEDGDSEDVVPEEVYQIAFPHAIETPHHPMQRQDIKQGASYRPPDQERSPNDSEHVEKTEQWLEDWLNDVGNDGSESYIGTSETAEESVQSSDSESNGRRRSKRTKRSTVIYVGKDAVKRDNNYVVKGDTYKHGVFTEQGPPRKHKPRPTKAAPGPKKPRVLSAVEQGRAEMKNRIQSNILAKQAARQAFLVKHEAPLRPFTDVAFEKPKGDSSIFEEVMQPDTIQADLRDYQLQGLNFMSAMYQQNMSMILGDGKLCASASTTYA